MPSVRKILIIGGGFAGLECARLLAGNPYFEVTLVDRQNHHVFQPLLYQVATASLAAPDIARSIRQILARARNVTVLMDEITSIDVIGKTASGRSGVIHAFDVLVLSAGARTGYFGHDDWERHTLGLKSLADAQAIRRRVLANLELAELTQDEVERRKLMTVAIIGGGPTGVELAGAFADLVHRSLKSNFRRIDTRTLRVILIEGSERILESYTRRQSDYARQRLEKLGVEVRTETRVTDIAERRLTFQDGSGLEAAAIIWAAGIVASPLTAGLGVATDRSGRVAPEPDLSLPGHPDIFVVGDLASVKDSEGNSVPGVAPAAVQMGSHVARLLIHEAILPETGRQPFRYRDKGTMAIIGKNHAVVKSGRIAFQGYFAWLTWLFVHIVFLIGFRNKLAVMLGWGYAYLRNNPEARIIANPPAMDSTKPFA